MTNKIIISAKDLTNARVKTDNFEAEITLEYCLVDLRHYTIKITPEHYRAMEVVCELARQIREDAGISE